jgi:ribonuclease P protein component
VLPTAHRLRDADSFRTAVRRGRRAGSRTLVVHLVAGRDGGAGTDPPRVGFVVSKAVGNAAVRNRVKRRLRHLAREHLASLPGSAVLVVRALPAAGSAGSAELGADLARCLERVR